MTRSPRAEALIEAAAALKGKAGSGAVLKLLRAGTMRELRTLVLTQEMRCDVATD